MNISESWPTLVSIILGLAVAELLLNLYRLIDARKRVNWDPLPLLWAVIVLLWLFNHWWAVATNLDKSQNARVVGNFVLLAIDPIILFLMAASVLPRVPGAEGRFDMRADWTERRGVFLTLFAIHQSVVWISMAILGSASWDFASFVRTVVLLLMLLLLFFKGRRLEWIAALTIFVLMVLRLSGQPAR
jgi:hypothetical protein